MRAFARSTPRRQRKGVGDHARNENYGFNTNIYLANRQPDQALAILQSLEQTVKPEMASQVARAI